MLPVRLSVLTGSCRFYKASRTQKTLYNVSSV
nr:MAG TPA: hypothetical protein [Caudoviricetes sp.]